MAERWRFLGFIRGSLTCLLKAQEIGETSLAIRIAVLLQERDIMSRGEAIRDQDLRSRVERLLLIERQGQRSAEQDMTNEAVCSG